MLALSALSLVGFTGCGQKGAPAEAPTTNASPSVRGERIQTLKPAAATDPALAQESAGASTNESERIDPATIVTSPGPVASISAPLANAPAGYTAVGFDKLASFAFDVSDDLLLPGTNAVEVSATIDKKIPAPVKALDKQAVALTGFMLPLKVEAGTVTEFLIMRDQSMCCYGTTPKINEWVSVKTVKNGVKPLMDQPVTVIGKLHVGEIRENGYLSGIYQMDAEKLIE